METDRPHASRPLAPATRSGRLGAWLSLGGTVVFIALLIIDALQDGPDPVRFANLIALIAILAGGAALLWSMLRDRERSLLAFVALIPFALLLLALAAEATGLME